jgi:hypothetical protein
MQDIAYEVRRGHLANQAKAERQVNAHPLSARFVWFLFSLWVAFVSLRLLSFHFVLLSFGFVCFRFNSWSHFYCFIGFSTVPAAQPLCGERILFPNGRAAQTHVLYGFAS